MTVLQEKFKEAYVTGETEGNGTRSAEKAGYKGGPRTWEQVAFANLRIPKIANAIVEQRNEMRKESVATRQQRQLFWTTVYFDKSNTMGDRLRASELLGKSEADFTEGIIDRTESVIEPLTEQETADLKRLAALSTIKVVESKVIDENVDTVV